MVDKHVSVQLSTKGSRPADGATIETKFRGNVSTIEYILFPQRPGTVDVAAVSVAGAKVCELLTPLSEVIVTAVSVVGKVKVVVRHGFEFVIVIWNPMSTLATSG